jgi:seryl-tRNA synthetase
MVDINLFRKEKGGNPEILRESQRKRRKPVELIDEIIDMDLRWRANNHEVIQMRTKQKTINKDLSTKKKAGESVDDLIKEASLIKDTIVLKDKENELLKDKIDESIYKVGNLVHHDVVDSDNEDNNGLIRTIGDKKVIENARVHDELLYMIGGYEPKVGSKVAGHRGYYLTGPGLWLNQALINYGLAFLHKKGHKLMQTPFFMRKDAMKKVAQLEEFDESLYKIQSDGVDEGNEVYLIATSEQPICALHAGENLHPKTLPIKYAGYSTCFRKEAGSYGKDVMGIFRVHQFEKVEQFVITTPDKSWEMHETLMAQTEEFYQSLGLSYRVVSIVSGALNNAAAKKYDLEAWFPGMQNYRELVSNSNCTDYQSRRLNIQCGIKKEDQEKTFVHMLNCTLTATERTICCLLENYQTPNGVTVPEVLRPFLAPYLEDPTHIPFVRESQKAEKK